MHFGMSVMEGDLPIALLYAVLYAIVLQKAIISQSHEPSY